MEHFYLNLNNQVNDNNEHEVHRQPCYWLPNVQNREYLGFYQNANIAVSEAKKRHPYWSINGCAHCCPEADTD